MRFVYESHKCLKFLFFSSRLIQGPGSRGPLKCLIQILIFQSFRKLIPVQTQFLISEKLMPVLIRKKPGSVVQNAMTNIASEATIAFIIITYEFA